MDENKWQVPSQSMPYNVKKVLSQCECQLRCTSCGTCIHMFVCTTIHSTVCKHVHLICLEENPILSKQAPRCNETDTTPLNTYFSTLLSQTTTSEVNKTRQKLHDRLQYVLNSSTHTTSNDALRATYKMVNAAAVVLHAVESTSNTPTILSLTEKRSTKYQPPATAYIFSTKKKPKTNSGLAKPTYEQISLLTSSLLDEEPLFCVSCFQKEDKTSNNEIKWIQCTHSDVWLHQSCVNDVDLDVENEFLCQNDKNTHNNMTQ